ncbi:hydroxymethylglutaryl-CoA lyase [Alteromonas sp. C1M14]|uniref:hydroxymethylglutaryl-CoA lyase n=1 Tax=Alteromonas sp. C1M14 TaxID=2841567 RepID=UPI001C0A4662|nr:hydroxymethylglutaryl-CoA lyase [Alteromonas sp. C1M14]MBU2976680.1 hydroxymethylglutaryl-CoA lyase [Alteromonas sp. C1M14]
MSSHYPNAVSIFEVGPRDGLQNENAMISTSDKVRFINLLAKAGLRRIEAGSFVSARWVPQMANSHEVFAELKAKDGVVYSALTPNLHGLEAALNAGVHEVAVFGSASETFSQRNIHCSIEESLARFAPVVTRATEAGIKVRGYVSCVLGCPYEGDISPQVVAKVAEALIDMGCYEVALGDTIGTGTPVKTASMLEALLAKVPACRVAVHFHDTYGQALANILIALQHGISTIDTAAGGLGGCPYAQGASGNVATEDVLYMLHGMGIKTGVSLPAVMRASGFIATVIGRPINSKVSQALAIR